MSTAGNTLIIAEAGVNHNGEAALAKKLIDAAAEAGADYVKFQTFKAESLVTKSAKKASYQLINSVSTDNTQRSMLKKLELTPQMHYELIGYCQQQGIRFLSTAFDVSSLEFLCSLGLRLAKLPSGEITNLPYLKKAASLFPDIILSTGMANMMEIRDALKVLTVNGAQRDRITILHCNTEYPTPMEDVNLKAMLHIQQEFNVRVGYSDHTLGIEVPIAAVALGARVIEKHFTLDRTMEGPDHRASLEPRELQAMISGIRNTELALSGDGIKQPSPSEGKNREIARKSIYLSRTVKPGEVLLSESLVALRPADGISPMDWEKVIGKAVKKELPEGHKLTWDDIA